MLLLLQRCKVRLFARVGCYEDRYACSAAPCTETLQQQQHFSKSWRLCHCSSSSSFSSGGNAMQSWWKAAAASGSTGKRFLDRGGHCALSCVRPPEATVTPRGCSTRTSGRASFGPANTADSRLFKVPTTYAALEQQQQRSRSRKARDPLGSTAGAGTANGAAVTSPAASASYIIGTCWFSAQAEQTSPPSGRGRAAVALVAGNATCIAAAAAAVAASALEAGTSAATDPGVSSIAATATAFFLSTAAATFPWTASAAAQSPATATASAGTLRVRESFFTALAFSRPPVVFSRSLVTSPVTFGISPGASPDTSPRPPAAAASAASSPLSPPPPVPASIRPASSPSGSSQFRAAAKYCSPLAGASASDIPDTATAHPASAAAAADCPSPPHHASAAGADIASPWPATRGATTSPGCPPAATRERSPASSAFPSPVAAAEASAPSASSAAAALQSLPFYAAGRTMPGQRLLPVTTAEADLLCASVVRYPTPQEVEGGIIVRLVRRCDPVSSPVLRCIRNRQFGIRGSERWQLLCVGFAGAALLFGLGCWQLRRMREKRDLIEYRRRQLRRKPVFIRAGPFPWTSGEAAQQQQQPQANEAEQLLLQQGERRLKGLHQRVQDHRRGETEEAREGGQAQHQQIFEGTTNVDPEQLAGSGAAVSEIWRRGVQSVSFLASLFFQQLLSYVSVTAACADAASAVDPEDAAAAGGSSTAATVVALPAVASAVAPGLPAPAAASPLPVRDRRTAAAAREACHSSLPPCSSSAAIPVASGAAEKATATCATPRQAPPAAAEAATPRGFATGRAALPDFSAATSGETNAVECFDSERSRGVAHDNTSLREEDVLREWSYRPVVVRGVLDTSVELKVGPRPGIENGSTGCCIISPLRLEDGQVLLVNKGHLLLPRARLPAFDRTQAVRLQRRQRLQQQREHGQQQAQESHFPSGSTGGSCRGESFSCSNRTSSGRSSEGLRGLTGGGGREEERAAAGAQAGAADAQDAKDENAEGGRGFERLLGGDTVAVASGWPGHVQETTPEWREEGEETDRSSSSGHGLTTRDEPPGWVTVRGVLEPGELLPNATARGLFSWMHAGNRPKENQFLYVVPKDLVEALAPRGIIRDAAATSMFVVNAYDILYDDDVLTALKKAELEEKRVKRLLEQQRQEKLQQHAPQQQQPRDQQQPPQTEETCLQRRQPEHQGTAAEAHQQTFRHAGEQDNRTREHKQQQQEATEQERQGTYACHMAAARAERPRGLRIGGWFRDGHPRSSILSYSPPSAAALVNGEIREEEEESSAAGADSNCTVFSGTEANAQSGAAAEVRPAATSATVRPPAVDFPSAASPRAASTASAVPFAPAASAPAASQAAAATRAAPVFFPRSIAAMFEHPTSLSALLRIPGVRRRFADYQQKRKDDYLLFWADEHTHFNYACQWFLMAVCCACMTLYKFVEVSRWKF